MVYNPSTQQNHMGGYGARNLKMAEYTKILLKERSMEISLWGLSLLFFTCLDCDVRDVSYICMGDTVDSPLKADAPWQRLEFVIGSCVPYSALSAMKKGVARLSMLCPGLTPPVLRSL